MNLKTTSGSDISIVRLNNNIPIIKQHSNRDIPLIAQPVSITSPSPALINEHYKDFQQALYMLKVSVEELWRLELNQLDKLSTRSEKSPNAIFDLQVPSIFPCRPVVPVQSQTTIQATTVKKPSSTVTNLHIRSRPSPISLSTPSPETRSTKSNPKVVRSMISSLLNKPKASQSSLLMSKKSKQRGSGDNSRKYCTKKAFLHLKFRCSKHTR